MSIPKAPWASAVQSRRHAGRFIPQAIAHRGYKAAWPENTMAGFQAAVSVGAHALETDIHLSSDGVVVLSHDPTLKRCYGVDAKIKDCTWEYLRGLETLREPKQKMPALHELLAMLNKPGMEKVWLLLDIKIDDDAQDLLGAVARTLNDVEGVRPWDQRIVLGCWNATFIKAARQHLPTHPMVLISFYLPYVNHFAPIPNLGYNILQYSLRNWAGSRFLRRARDENRTVLTWTVNEVEWMEWCIHKNLSSAKEDSNQKQLSEEDDDDGDLTDSTPTGDYLIDGVISDDPKLYLEVCERIEDEIDGKERVRSSESAAPVKKGLKAKVGAWSKDLMWKAMVPFFFWLRVWEGKLDYFKDARTLEL